LFFCFVLFFQKIENSAQSSGLNKIGLNMAK
jgi:hypothetical protein